MTGFPRLVLFDLDGTLLDSAPDMLAAQANISGFSSARRKAPKPPMEMPAMKVSSRRWDTGKVWRIKEGSSSRMYLRY